MDTIRQGEEQVPTSPAAPKSDFTERMKQAKAKKQGTSPFINQVSAPPPIVKIPPSEKKKIKKQADHVIFRTLGRLHPILQNDVVEHGRRSHAYLAPYGTILWPYKNDKPLPLDTDTSELKITDEWGRSFDNQELQWLPRNIRYVFNLRSCFEDEQEAMAGDTLRRNEAGRNQILDNPQNRDALTIPNRELKVRTINTVLINFLWLSPQCENMHPKARRINGIPVYKMIDFGQIDQDKILLGKLREQCYRLAQNARIEEMIPHAKYLNIPFTEEISGEERDIDAIREDYKEWALNNPKEFERTFGDPKIKIIYSINRLVEVRELSINSITPGQVHWFKTRKFITMIPPDQDPIEFLADFSLTTDGIEFASQIQAYKINNLI